MVYEDRTTSIQEKKAKKTIGKFYQPSEIDTSVLETIAYQYPKNRIDVTLETDEFSCVCPFSGLPDFAQLSIKYVPRRKLIEMKSLKYYLTAFRNVKIYNEHVVNKILKDLKAVLNPWEIIIDAKFTSRGGITNHVNLVFKAKK